MARAVLPFRYHAALANPFRRRPARQLAGELALGLAGVAAGAFALYFIKERNQEEAEHSVLESEGAFSVRRYARLLTAEVVRSGSLTQAMDAAYTPLAEYIGAKPHARQAGASDRKIAMTVPVSVSPRGGRAGHWTVRFVMPRAWSRASLPEPANGVELGELPPRTIAVVRFAGRATDDALMVRKRQELLDWTARRGLRRRGEPEFAAYNAPIVPGALRRNEWWVEVEPQ